MDTRRTSLGLFALGALAVVGVSLARKAGLRASGALPGPVAAIVRRHSTPEDFESFSEAVADHVKAGRPLTRAAAAALAAVHLDPEHVPMIARELKASGWLR